MPKSCYECQLLEGDKYDGLCHGANRWLDDDYFRWYVYPEGDIDDTKPVNCPLIEVPTPHGRLGDLDRLYKQIKAECNPYGKPTIGFEDGKKVMKIIADAPTVIEAEE